MGRGRYNVFAFACRDEMGLFQPHAYFPKDLWLPSHKESQLSPLALWLLSHTESQLSPLAPAKQVKGTTQLAKPGKIMHGRTAPT